MKIDKNKIRCANSLEDIKTYQDYFFDIIYSDPPYNLSSEWFIDKDGRYKLKRTTKDFLSKWNGLSEDDLDLLFNESYRTLKYGGYLILYGMDRQLGPFHYYAVKNGFEVCQSLYWFFMCNDEETEILSKRGWLKHNDITEDDIVLTLNTKTELSEWQKVNNIFKYNVKDFHMVRLQNRSLDQLVTPNHRILRKFKTNQRYKYGDWVYTEAAELVGRKSNLTLIPSAYPNKEGNKNDNTLYSGSTDGYIFFVKNYFELLGWIFTDGNYQKDDNSIRITQCKPEVRMKLERLLKDLNVDYKLYEKTRDITIGTYEYPDYFEYIYYFNDDLSKQIRKDFPDKLPTWDLLDYDYDCRLSLLEGLMSGDGSYKREGQGTFKKNGKIEDFVQALIQTLGLRNQKQGNRISFSENNNIGLQKPTTLEKYTGKIWSVNTDNSNYCIRRNGKVSFTGNSNFPKASAVDKMVDKRFNTITKTGNKKLGAGSKGNNWNPTTTFDEQEYDELIPTHPIAKKYEGYKYSIAPLKQVMETIMVFHKPLKNKSYIDDIIECEKNNEIHSSCLNIDGERVEYKDDKPDPVHRDCNNNRDITFTMGFTQNSGWHYDPSETGRFPSQLLVDENAAKIIDEQTGNLVKQGLTKQSNKSGLQNNFVGGNCEKPVDRKVYLDNEKGGSKILHICKPDDDIHPSCLNIEGERVEYISDYDKKHQDDINKGTGTFFGGKGLSVSEKEKDGRFPSQLLVDEGAANVIDNQTGVRSGGKYTSRSDRSNTYLGNYRGEDSKVGKDYPDGCGSKILHTCKYEENEMDLLKYQPKVSKSERNAGLEGFDNSNTRIGATYAGQQDTAKIGGNPDKPTEPRQNSHPTLKPISLNKHILNLFKTPNHTRIYIPFSGSGSEVIAANQVGYDEIYAAEINEDYCKIALARIKYWEERSLTPKKTSSNTIDEDTD